MIDSCYYCIPSNQTGVDIIRGSVRKFNGDLHIIEYTADDSDCDGVVDGRLMLFDQRYDLIPNDSYWLYETDKNYLIWCWVNHKDYELVMFNRHLMKELGGVWLNDISTLPFSESTSSCTISYDGNIQTHMYIKAEDNINTTNIFSKIINKIKEKLSWL